MDIMQADAGGAQTGLIIERVLPGGVRTRRPSGQTAWEVQPRAPVLVRSDLVSEPYQGDPSYDASLEADEESELRLFELNAREGQARTLAEVREERGRFAAIASERRVIKVDLGRQVLEHLGIANPGFARLAREFESRTLQFLNPSAKAALEHDVMGCDPTGEMWAVVHDALTAAQQEGLARHMEVSARWHCFVTGAHSVRDAAPVDCVWDVAGPGVVARRRPVSPSLVDELWVCMTQATAAPGVAPASELLRDPVVAAVMAEAVSSVPGPRQKLGQPDPMVAAAQRAGASLMQLAGLPAVAGHPCRTGPRLRARSWRAAVSGDAFLAAEEARAAALVENDVLLSAEREEEEEARRARGAEKEAEAMAEKEAAAAREPAASGAGSSARGRAEGAPGRAGGAKAGGRGKGRRRKAKAGAKGAEDAAQAASAASAGSAAAPPPPPPPPPPAVRAPGGPGPADTAPPQTESSARLAAAAIGRYMRSKEPLPPVQADLPAGAEGMTIRELIDAALAQETGLVCAAGQLAAVDGIYRLPRGANLRRAIRDAAILEEAEHTVRWPSQLPSAFDGWSSYRANSRLDAALSHGATMLVRLHNLQALPLEPEFKGQEESEEDKAGPDPRRNGMATADRRVIKGRTGRVVEIRPLPRSQSADGVFAALGRITGERANGITARAASYPLAVVRAVIAMRVRASAVVEGLRSATGAGVGAGAGAASAGGAAELPTALRGKGLGCPDDVIRAATAHCEAGPGGSGEPFAATVEPWLRDRALWGLDSRGSEFRLLVACASQHAEQAVAERTTWYAAITDAVPCAHVVRVLLVGPDVVDADGAYSPDAPLPPGLPPAVAAIGDVAFGLRWLPVGWRCPEDHRSHVFQQARLRRAAVLVSCLRCHRAEQALIAPPPADAPAAAEAAAAEAVAGSVSFRGASLASAVAAHHRVSAPAWRPAPLRGLAPAPAAGSVSGKAKAKAKAKPKGKPKGKAKGKSKPGKAAAAPDSRVPTSLHRFLDSSAVTWAGDPSVVGELRAEFEAAGPAARQGWMARRFPAERAMVMAAVHHPASLHGVPDGPRTAIAALAATGVPLLLTSATRAEFRCLTHSTALVTNTLLVQDRLAKELCPMATLTGRHAHFASERRPPWAVRGARTLVERSAWGTGGSLEALSDATDDVGFPNALSVLAQGVAGEPAARSARDLLALAASAGGIADTAEHRTGSATVAVRTTGGAAPAKRFLGVHTARLDGRSTVVQFPASQLSTMCGDALPPFMNESEQPASMVCLASMAGSEVEAVRAAQRLASDCVSAPTAL